MAHKGRNNLHKWQKQQGYNVVHSSDMENDVSIVNAPDPYVTKITIVMEQMHLLSNELTQLIQCWQVLEPLEYVIFLCMLTITITMIVQRCS